MSDIEKIRNELERRIALFSSLSENTVNPNRLDECKQLLSFLDTIDLEEEPVLKGYDEAYLNEKITKASKTWKGVNVDKYMDEVRGREPDKNLVEEASRLGFDYVDNIVHEYPEHRWNDHDVEFGFRDAFIAGAEWYEEQFEKNRLAHCDAASQEDCDRETDFAMEIIEKEHRQPTFLDAINYGMRLQKDALLEWIKEVRAIPHENTIARDLAFQEVINKLNSM